MLAGVFLLSVESIRFSCSVFGLCLVLCGGLCRGLERLAPIMPCCFWVILY